jgi:hypothetical protein
LTDIAEIKGGKRLPAGEQFSEDETPFPYIRVTDMVSGTVKDRELVYVTPAIERLIRNYKISSRDLYVTVAGTLGQFGSIPEHLDGAQLTENAAKITKIDTGRVDVDYLCHYLVPIRKPRISKAGVAHFRSKVTIMLPVFATDASTFYRRAVLRQFRVRDSLLM